MQNNDRSQDIFDLDVREIVESNNHSTPQPMTISATTACSNACTGQCCTIANCAAA
ncbi:hypothetical protein [Streptomyces violascens]|uniref:hypothetical protein n=1 Tax=Streptomyces violascens TaxID=67381 RepID=UPI001CFDE9B9|nr:hypothetical protein [Streptomyces violascens]